MQAKMRTHEPYAQFRMPKICAELEKVPWTACTPGAWKNATVGLA